MSFKWSVYKVQEIKNLLGYFKINPLRSAKLHRLNLIDTYFELRKIKAHLQTPTSVLGKLWNNF
jgi:hypothetical protein